MKRAELKIYALLALTGGLALAPSPARAAKAQMAGCDANIDVMPNALKNGATSCQEEHCREQDKWIRNEAQNYVSAVRAACQHTNEIVSKMGENNQQGAQKNAHTNYVNGATSMEQVITKGDDLRRETATKAKAGLQELQKTKGNNSAVSDAARMFDNPSRFENQVPPSPLQRDATHRQSDGLYQNSAEFIHKLYVDRKKRKEIKDRFDTAAAQANGNAENGGTAKKEDGKGMDPSSLMGPLAALAGMAQKKNQEQPAASDLSSPATGASTTPAAEAKLGNSVVKASNLADSGAKNGAGNSTTLTPGAGDHPASDAGAAGSQYGSSLSSSPYKDAFTGYGANGTTPGTFSPSGGGAAAGGAGASGEGERNTASTAHSPAEEEALSSFGGGGLNFAGGSGGNSSSSHGAESEGVKDFLQDAETNLSDGAFDEAGSEVAADASGVEGEDGTELFRRVRSALERSQRKGAVLSGLSGPKDPRFR